MKKFFFCLALMQLPIIVLAQDYLPRDVQRFVDRRQGCDHMRGEVDRTNELSREIRKLCDGTDKELARLKRNTQPTPPLLKFLTSSKRVSRQPKYKSQRIKRDNRLHEFFVNKVGEFL